MAGVLTAKMRFGARDKGDIQEAQYESFYRHISGNLDTPWRHLHIRGEGLVSFTALLYVPTLRPFDLYDPARATHVRLYVRRIFISEGNHGLLPQWLRFIRGVVDSEDLPLNVSRETLQADKSVFALAGSSDRKTPTKIGKHTPPKTLLTLTISGIPSVRLSRKEFMKMKKFRSRLLALARFATTHTLHASTVQPDTVQPDTVQTSEGDRR